MRAVLARDAVRWLEDGIDPMEAARRAVKRLADLTGGSGGLILIDRHGRIGHARNTSHMPVCSIRGDAVISAS